MAKQKKKKKNKSNGAPGVTFIREVSEELTKTEWLSAREVVKLSVTVIISAGLLGAFLNVLDILFRKLLALII